MKTGLRKLPGSGVLRNEKFAPIPRRPAEAGRYKPLSRLFHPPFKVEEAV